MHEIFIESARISFLEGVLICIGILWVAGYLKKIIYVPVIIKEKKEEEINIIAKNNDHIIYREHKKPEDNYTDFEEIKS